LYGACPAHYQKALLDLKAEGRGIERASWCIYLTIATFDGHIDNTERVMDECLEHARAFSCG